jgi:arabinofuranosyltransferase
MTRSILRRFPQIVSWLKTWSLRKATLILAPVATLCVILPNAWITDDAYISLRAAKNLLLGFGPTWNVAERVQVFTHPLWMIPLTVAQWLFPGNVAQAVIGFGIIFTLAALIVFIRGLKPVWLVILSVLLMLSSKAFIDFSTSGLENPMLYLLIVLFAREYLGRRRIFALTLIASLAATTRADAALLFVPAFLPLIWHHWRSRRFWLDILKGAIPLIIWEAFSLIYFGYLLPNTVYAKLHTGILPAELYQHGWYYLQNSFNVDKITLPVIVLALVVVALQRNLQRLLLGAGILLYFVAVFRAGGDYMSGRFLAVPFVLALYLIATWLQTKTFQRYSRIKSAHLKLGVVGILLLAVFVTPHSPVTHPLAGTVDQSRDDIQDANRIADEARFYCPWTCLYHLDNQDQNVYYQEGMALRHQAFGIYPSIGMSGYFADTRTYIVDPLALADPLLSRLPAMPGSRIGHFKRQIPAGYPESIQQHQNLVADPCIHDLYTEVHSIVADPIFAPHRLKEVIKANLGLTDRQYRRCVAGRAGHK